MTAADAGDSTPDQQRWGDVPNAELRAPDRADPPDRFEGRYRDDRRPPPPPRYGADYSYDDVTGGAEGTWEGIWRGEYDGRPYEYSGSFDGEYRPVGAPYAMPGHDGPPPHGPGPHHGPHPAITQHGSQVIINGLAYPAGGTVANGYYYPPATTTTITVQPGVQTAAMPAVAWTPAPKRHWQPKPKSKVIRMTK